MKTEKKFKIGILGATYYTNNYGVRVLLSGSIESILKIYPLASFKILDYGNKPFVWNEKIKQRNNKLELINLRFSWKLHLPNNVLRILLFALIDRIGSRKLLRYYFFNLNKWFRSILECDLFLAISGGDSFSDIYGLRRFFYVALPQLVVIMLKKNLVLLPQTYGPFNSILSKIISGWIIQRSIIAYSRDIYGISLLKKLVKKEKKQVELCPDIGFSMTPSPVSEKISSELKELNKDNRLVGLNISKLLYMGGYNKKNMFGLKENYASLITNLIEFIINELEAKILLIPHVSGGSESEESEIELCKRIYFESKPINKNTITFYDKNFSHKQVKTIIGHCGFFIGSRMHACIAAISMCVPSLGLAYSNKFKGAINLVSTDIPIIDLRTSSRSEVLKEIKDAFLKRELIKKECLLKVPLILQKIDTALKKIPQLVCSNENKRNNSNV